MWLCFTCDQPDAVDGLGSQMGYGDEVPAEVQVPGGPGGCGELFEYVDDGAYSYS